LKWSVILTEAAEQDINAAAVWYESEVTGLGRQFLDAVSMTLERVEHNPQQFSVVYGDKRRALLSRFPYGLYFRIDVTSVVVVGCFHGHRNPRAWQTRR
jgi:toxin ParE1/3/4